jgi:hypothetical protein
MYGRTELEWDELVRAGRKYLEEIAWRKDGFTDYTKLNHRLAEDTGQPLFDFSHQDGRNAIARLLGEIARQTHAEQDFMLSALVLYQNAGTAGSGFFKLAKQLYPDTVLSTEQQKDAFWMHQVEAIRALYPVKKR